MKTPTSINNPQYCSDHFDLFKYYEENLINAVSPRVRDFKPEYFTLHGAYLRTLYLHSKTKNTKEIRDFAIAFCDGLSLRPQIITSYYDLANATHLDHPDTIILFDIPTKVLTKDKHGIRPLFRIYNDTKVYTHKTRRKQYTILPRGLKRMYIADKPPIDFFKSVKSPVFNANHLEGLIQALELT